MNRRSRSISPRRHRGNSIGGGGSGYRRYSRSRSRSRERSRDQNYRRRNSRSRSRDRDRERDRYRHGSSHEKDLYRDIINSDYQEERNYGHSRNGSCNNGGIGGGNASNNGGNNSLRYRNFDIYNDDRIGDNYERSREKNSRDYEREYERDRKERDYKRYGNSSSGSGRRYNSSECDRESDESDDNMNDHVYNKTPSNTIIVLGLQSHITEADIMSALIQMGMSAASIRLIRKRTTGASRGFAFVEFNTVDEAAHWMELTQGSLLLQDTCRGTLQYSHSREQNSKSKMNANDWYCGKCGVFNFKRRDNCFKCCASREESERGGEGSDEVSNILTKKIMLRNLDVLTNEEGVLTAIQLHAPELAKKITKVLISRDALTQTSRGICYLNFETLIDSMGLHNALSTLDPPLKIDGREVIVTYCIDHENRQMGGATKRGDVSSSNTNVSNISCGSNLSNIIGPLTAADIAAAAAVANNTGVQGLTGSVYTLADVPRLAEYSASIYATTPSEHAHYLKYYTDYYVSEIKKGSFGNLPTDAQLTEANSGAAVALSAIQRKQKKMNSIETTATAAAAAAASAAAAVKASFCARSIVTPKGNDGKVYPTPDVSLYQYDETSGYYYDPTTGLYYDAHSQYYYNSETGAYLYWDQRKSTYVLATPASAAASLQEALQKDSSDDMRASSYMTNNADHENSGTKDKKDANKHDKVKVAKKIVKDMEKWAKQLNQKKDYTAIAASQPILITPKKGDATRSGGNESTTTAAATSASVSGISSPSSTVVATSSTASTATPVPSTYADVGFSILEKKTNKLTSNYNVLASGGNVTHSNNNKVQLGGSDSEEDNHSSGSKGHAPLTEKDYVDFQKLTCLLCKRVFQSLEILQKHLKMSNLHKENLVKHNLESKDRKQSGLKQTQSGTDSLAAALSYRDRAKERRQKYGESDPPPPNRSRERFETELSKISSRKYSDNVPSMPIGTNNVGNRLLQKMGWSEGQGLGRKNQGRTSIIEAETRSSTAGLGIKSGNPGSGDDYKTYIKKMMKSRYESV